MIPSIRSRIDQSNLGIEHGQGDADRVKIPPEEIQELSELRKREHAQRAHDEHDARVAEFEAVANLIQEQDNAVDVEKAFGLPQGLASHDIWEKILNFIDDPEDIGRIARTCQLFWHILKGKYKAVRLTEVVLLISQRDTLRNMHRGWRPDIRDLDDDALMALRRISHSSKVTIDTLLLRDSTDEWWFSHSDWTKQWIPKPDVVVSKARLPTLDKRLSMLTEMQNIPHGTFPLKEIRYYEPVRTDPDLMVLRIQFKGLLGFVGSSITEFHFDCGEGNFGSYNQLRSLIILMPNVAELHVSIFGQPWEPLNPHPPPEIELQPFPSCPSLKRFKNHGSGFPSQFLVEIFRANPQISGIMYYYDEPLQWEQREVQEFVAVLNALNMLQMERFILYGEDGIPPIQFFEYRFGWPLKHLTLTVENPGEPEREFPSRTVFAFINSFRMTLEELVMEWKVRDTGGFLDLPKLSKLFWKFSQNFSTFDFMVALENLQEFAVDIACPSINETVIMEKNLPSVFPRLRKIQLAYGSRFSRRKVLWKS